MCASARQDVNAAEIMLSRRRSVRWLLPLQRPEAWILQHLLVRLLSRLKELEGRSGAVGDALVVCSIQVYTLDDVVVHLEVWSFERMQLMEARRQAVSVMHLAEVRWCRLLQLAQDSSSHIAAEPSTDWQQEGPAGQRQEYALE